jgi:dynein heavy chain 2, cytosolic
MISIEQGKNKSHVEITWENPEQLSCYIDTVRAAAEKFKNENVKLRRQHAAIEQIVFTLINTDLLREQKKWHEQAQEIRKQMKKLLTDGYAADQIKSWRTFWDRQLYKALDLQYEIGLKTFNENLSEIHIDLVFG